MDCAEEEEEERKMEIATTSIVYRFFANFLLWIKYLAIQATSYGKSKKISQFHKIKKEPRIPSLFPENHNVDDRLGLSCSVFPCSIDISTLQSPISMTRTPDGNMEWKLNTSSIDESSLGQPVVLGATDSASDAMQSQQKLEEEDHQAETHQRRPASPISHSSVHQVKEEDNDKDKEKFVCHYCDAEFRIRGYLTRHIKKHAVEKAYRCPFFNANAPPETRCHTTGGFSRRDTYKTHLRSRHFIYPEGVKTQDRNRSSGHCAHCGKWFENTSKWIENHIESGYCTGLPEGTILPAKSARKAGKLKMIKTSTGHSRFITTRRSVVEPKVLLNKDAIEAMQIVVNETNNNGQPTLTKLSDNRIMMNPTNFKGEPKAKKTIKRQRKKRFDSAPANYISAMSVHHPMSPTLSVKVNSTTRTSSSTSATPGNPFSSYSYQQLSSTPLYHQQSQISQPHSAQASFHHPPHPSLPLYHQQPNFYRHQAASSAPPLQHSFTTPDQTPLDEICLSLNPSPADDAGLEPVRSASSLSSHDCNQSTNNDMTKPLYPLVPTIADTTQTGTHETNITTNHNDLNQNTITNINNNNNKTNNNNSNFTFTTQTTYNNNGNNNYSLPLDMEQMSLTIPMEDPITAQHYRFDEEPQINITLNKQMDPIKLGERQLREAQQYLNFYNYNFDTHL